MAYEGDLYGFGPRAGRMPDPFNDLASAALPRTILDALRWSQAIAQVDPTFREAMERVASYFITDIEVRPSTRSGVGKISKGAKDKFEEFLRKTLLIGTALRRTALDFLVYGNSFTSVVAPISRHLHCPHCPGLIYPLRTVYRGKEFAFRWDGASCEFHARCPKCGKQGAWTRIDRDCGPEADVVVKHWSVHEIEIRHQMYRDSRRYIWKIPDVFRRQVREGELIDLEETPWEIIRAAAKGDNFMFAKGVIYHMYEPPLCGFDAAGWGISKALTNFRQAWTCQMLRRFNEAICQEFLVPFRVLSPAARAGSETAVDPLVGTNLMNFRASMASMIRRHRRDPGEIQISPVPVEYQMLGGEANQLAPFQLIEQATDMLLNGSGVPADLYKGTLSLQAAPVGLRLFEARWKALVDQLNQFLDAVVDRVAELFSWEPVDAKLIKVTHADDLNRQMAVLQLMMGGQISQQTGLRSLGLDFPTEQNQLVEEKEFIQDAQDEMAEKAEGSAAQRSMNAASGASPFAAPQQPQQPGQPAAGGQGGQPQPQPDDSQASPEQIDDQAKQIAAQLQAAPDAQRRSTLVRLKQQSPVLHGVVVQHLDDQKQQAQQQGGRQVLQQQFGKAAARPRSLAEIRGLLESRRVA